MIRYSFFFFFIGMASLGKSQDFFERADDFFSKYVREGRVDYKSITQNSDELNNLVKEIAELDLSNKRVTADYLKAFYINAYNLLVIDAIVDYYPTDGPMEIDGFFDHIVYTVMNEKVTLNQLEKEILFEQFPDARLHFVLVCAAKGCPELSSASYQPESLDKQLEMRTMEAVNSEGLIRVNKNTVLLSKIFEWYQADFTNESKDLISFVNTYRSDKIKSDKIEFFEYDWSLNELK